jgi:benzoate membrane transport protein
MSGLVEPPAAARPGFRDILRDLGATPLTNGVVGFLFAATGPLAIILAAAAQGNLGRAELVSWVFGVFFINGVGTIVLTWYYRQPLCLFWTIPGTVLVGQALTHLTFAEVVGTYFAASLLVLALGVTGFARRVMDWFPLPIVMGMVAGVFLRFGLDIVRALHSDILLAGAMLAVFLTLTALPVLGRLVPPILGALAVGVLVVMPGGRIGAGEIGALALASPVFTAPVFSLAAMAELVVPLAITILLVQNGQGIAVLAAAGHRPPVTAITIACGIGGLASACVGAVGTCLTGPTNAILTASGARERQYAGAFVVAILAVLFGLGAPMFVTLMLAAPKELIMMLGGLAMLRVLLGAFTTAFRGPFALGALTAFLVTVADLPILNIGAAFWGLVAGLAIAWLIERDDFRRAGSTVAPSRDR